MKSTPHRPSSPCIGRCSTVLGDDVCRGCGRTFTEIANWILMTEEEKETVWQKLDSLPSQKRAVNRDE